MSQASLSKTSLIFLTLALLAQNGVVLVRADSTFVGSYCEDTSGSYTEGDVFQVSLGQVVGSLTDVASGNAFFSNITAGSGDGEVFGLYYCNGAMEASDCSACVEAAAKKIQSDCTTKEAIVWYLECTLRYANRDIFSQLELSPYAYLALNQTVTDATTFTDVLTTTLTGVMKDAAFNSSSEPPAYAAAQEDLSSTQSLVAVAQCTPDILGPACTECLLAAVANMSSCCGNTVGAMVFLPSCQLLYAISDSSTAPSSSNSDPFFIPSSSTSTPSSAKPSGRGKLANKSKGSVLRSKGNVLAGVLAAIGIFILMSLNIAF